MDELAREVHFVDLMGALVGGLLFILAMSLVREPARQRFNAIFVAGAGAAYLNGGLGLWEFPYMALATAAAYLGLKSYRFIGAAWILHVFWDVVHHLYGNPIWHWQPLSSAGCAVLDTVIAIWFLTGAPNVYQLLRSPHRVREIAS